MEAEIFKKITANIFKKNSFVKKGNYFRKSGDGVIASVNLQHSNFSSSYYINAGFVIEQINPGLKDPKDYQTDLSIRFFMTKDGEKIIVFDLDSLNDSDIPWLEEGLQKNLDEFVNNYLSVEGLKLMLKTHPDFLKFTKGNAREFLGYV